MPCTCIFFLLTLQFMGLWSHPIVLLSFSLPVFDTHCPHRMWSRVYETVERPSVSVLSIERSSGVRRVCHWAPDEQEISIDCCSAPLQQAPALSSCGASARCSAANSGSVVLTAEVGSWTQTCLCRRIKIVTRNAQPSIEHTSSLLLPCETNFARSGLLQVPLFST